MKKSVYILIVVLNQLVSLFNNHTVYGQYTHFSNPQSAPLTINPAHTGNYHGDWRLCNTYRSQWHTVSKPYITKAASYDRQFYFQHDILSAGIMIVNEKSGNSVLTSNQIQLSIAYQKQIKNHTTHIGFQAGYVTQRFSLKKLTFPEQFDMQTGYFNPEMVNNEKYLEHTISFPDVSTGFLWNRTSGKVRPEAGFSFYHLNYPLFTFQKNNPNNEKYDDTSEEIKIRKVFHTRIEIQAGELFSCIPEFIMMIQNPATELLYGIKCIYDMQGKDDTQKSILFSMHIRDGHQAYFDALIFGGGIRYKKTGVMVSYDCNMSNLRVASKYFGAFEVTFVYTGISTRHINGNKPCFRF